MLLLSTCTVCIYRILIKQYNMHNYREPCNIMSIYVYCMSTCTDTVHFSVQMIASSFMQALLRDCPVVIKVCDH